MAHNTDKDKPVQHTPRHVGKVADPNHPAASAFAPLQPAAGVVADDVEERGQNLAGGPKASEANKTYSDQPEKLREQHFAERKAQVEDSKVGPLEVDGDQAKAADSGKSSKK